MFGCTPEARKFETSSFGLQAGKQFVSTELNGFFSELNPGFKANPQTVPRGSARVAPAGLAAPTGPPTATGAAIPPWELVNGEWGYHIGDQWHGQSNQVLPLVGDDPLVGVEGEHPGGVVEGNNSSEAPAESIIDPVAVEGPPGEEGVEVVIPPLVDRFIGWGTPSQIGLVRWVPSACMEEHTDCVVHSKGFERSIVYTLQGPEAWRQQKYHCFTHKRTFRPFDKELRQLVAQIPYMQPLNVVYKIGRSWVNVDVTHFVWNMGLSRQS